MKYFLMSFKFIIIFISLSLHISVYSQQVSKGLMKLTKESDVIVVGKIEKLSSHWNENKSRIFTRIDLNVTDNLKGQPDKKLIFENPGGEIDGIGELYSHTAKFSQDENVLLFLKKDKKGNLYINNGTEGKFLISAERIESENTIQSAKLKNLKEQIRRIIKEQ